MWSKLRPIQNDCQLTWIELSVTIIDSAKIAQPTIEMQAQTRVR